MKIKCESNTGKNLEHTYIRETFGYSSSSRFEGLTVGQEYNVYAVGLRKSEVWFYICDDHFVDSPRKYPECLFKVVDRSLSKNWVWSHYEDNEDQTYFLAPLIWAEDECFFEKIVDGEDESVREFLKIKEEIDSEQN